jgi:4-hydroxy-3-polyprenylbenzoate decarboxylase
MGAEMDSRQAMRTGHIAVAEAPWRQQQGTVPLPEEAHVRTTYRDFREYLEELERRDLLVRVSAPINKDSELAPLVRWQFLGLKSEDRKGWLFTQPTDSRGRKFDGSVAMAVLGASPAVYAAAMGTTNFEEVSEIFEKAILSPLPSVQVAREDAPVKEVILSEEELSREGVDMFPVPVVNPGTDASAYFSSPVWITKDPETGEYNAGTYRSMIKAPRRLGVMVLPGQDGRMHWQRARALGKPLEAVMVVSPIPALTICSVSKAPTSEYDIAGAINGSPLELVPAETVDLLIPATAELAIEGHFRTDILESEGPFGEYTGFTGTREYAFVFEVTAITHRKSPVFQAFISEMPPSESSLIRKPGWEAPLRKELRQRVPSFVDANLFEESGTNYFLAIQLKSPGLGEAWHALHIANAFSSNCFKWMVAVDDDVDIRDLGNVIWALSYRVQPHRDIEIARGKIGMLDPSAAPVTASKRDQFYPGDLGCSVILIDATRKWAYPRISLPDRQRMTDARRIWEKLGLPPLNVRGTWHSYDLGYWPEQWATDAELAVAGRYLETGAALAHEQTLASFFETGIVKTPDPET